MILQDFLGIDLPVIQAPMAGVQTAALTIAVAEAGGLGSLPAALLAPDSLRLELESIRDHTKRPFNVNFFCHAEPQRDADRESRWLQLLKPYFDEAGIDPTAIGQAPMRTEFNTHTAAIVEPFAPDVVSFHFGLPSPELLQQVRSWGAKIFASATTVREALWLEGKGVDAIIAQGWEAGGHRGMFLSDDIGTQVGTFALVPQVVAATSCPVIAAGGIADANGVKAALDLGACGVQVGTAYLQCPEATISSVHRSALQQAASRETAVTNLFTGRPARGIVNRVMRELGYMNPAAPQFPLAATAMAALRRVAEGRALDDFSPLWCGQNLSAWRELPAAALTRELGAQL